MTRRKAHTSSEPYARINSALTHAAHSPRVADACTTQNAQDSSRVLLCAVLAAELRTHSATHATHRLRNAAHCAKQLTRPPLRRACGFTQAAHSPRIANHRATQITQDSSDGVLLGAVLADELRLLGAEPPLGRGFHVLHRGGDVCCSGDAAAIRGLLGTNLRGREGRVHGAGAASEPACKLARASRPGAEDRALKTGD